MPKITEEPLEAIQVRLFKADLDYLRGLYKGSQAISVNAWIRAVVRHHVKLARESAREAIDENERYAEPIEFSLPEDVA